MYDEDESEDEDEESEDSEDSEVKESDESDDSEEEGEDSEEEGDESEDGDESDEEGDDCEEGRSSDDDDSEEESGYSGSGIKQEGCTIYQQRRRAVEPHSRKHNHFLTFCQRSSHADEWSRRALDQIHSDLFSRNCINQRGGPLPFFLPYSLSLNH